MTVRRRDAKRAQALLGITTGSAQAEPVEPEPAPDDWGSNGAMAYRWPATTAVASVYVFDTYWDAREVEKKLRARPEGAQRGVTTVNGPLLLWATADSDDADGVALIKKLRSSFAGKE